MDIIKVVKSSTAPKDRGVLWIDPVNKAINLYDSSNGWVNLLASDEDNDNEET